MSTNKHNSEQTGVSEDDHRRDTDNGTDMENENRKKQSPDDLKWEEGMNSFERELINSHKKKQKMNRSTAPKQSTLVGDEMLESSENDDDEIGEERSQEEVEKIEKGWQNIQERVLASFLLDDETMNKKKRKGDSLERINDLKRERLEESIKFPNETKQQKINRKLEELNIKLIEIFTNLSEKKGEKVEMDTELKKLLGVIKSTNNKKEDDSIAEKTQQEVKCDHCKLKVEQERQREEQEKIKRALNMGGGKKTFMSICNSKWEEKAYIKTNWEQGGLRETVEKKTCLIVTKKDAKDKGVENIIKDVGEDLAETLEEVNEGEIKFLENFRRKENKKTIWYTFVAGIEKESGGDIYDLAEKAITKIKKEMDETPKVVRVVAGNDLNKEIIRKALEYVGRRESISWEMIVRGKELEVEKKSEQEEALLIKMGGKKYNEVLSEMREKIDIGKIGLQVEKLKRTNGGDLLVKLKGRGAAEKLRAELDSKMNGMDTAIRRKETFFTITRLDPGVGEETLKKMIKSYTGVPEREIEVKVLRTNRYGEQVATIAVRPSIAEELRRYGSIKIGWVVCPIMERHNPVRCFKCLKFGHNTYECKEESRAACCYNCLQTGHTVASCGNKPYCSVCKEEGHRMDRMACPSYRALVYGRGGEGNP
ncbi:golgin subfamily A member 6-like protein 22 [Diabrotica virgifera virgifera]|uniref:CCHC-type domain-containing protein n=2 Tax=Diabrotica virgifera virgifera TaxID=50390 RepID=A0ABM5KXH7_DIAVI|nr:golgin subfamily A member 6-like protein 22 [Diabrotica virgifera virgifera]XP_050514894.1 golgin subfamily A member 6-like protein 22 [Diabrotica virgifera virgifera]